MYHQAGEEVTFTAQYSVRIWGVEYQPGDVLTVGLVRDWDEEEGLGEGGPWGCGGYPSRLIASLSGDVKPRHAHTCLACGHEVEYGEFYCETDADHDFALCDECAARGVTV